GRDARRVRARGRGAPRRGEAGVARVRRRRRERRVHRLLLEVSMRAAPWVLFVAALGCLEVPAAPARDALAVTDVEASEGMSLETACTPTGPELCFNARDDNCNGIID